MIGCVHTPRGSSFGTQAEDEKRRLYDRQNCRLGRAGDAALVTSSLEPLTRLRNIRTIGGICKRLRSRISNRQRRQILSDNCVRRNCRTLQSRGAGRALSRCLSVGMLGQRRDVCFHPGSAEEEGANAHRLNCRCCEEKRISRGCLGLEALKKKTTPTLKNALARSCKSDTQVPRTSTSVDAGGF